MTTWSSYRDDFLRSVLSDVKDASAPDSVEFSDAELLQFANTSLAFLSEAYGKEASHTITGDGSSYTFSLPSDFAKVILVETDKRVFLPQLNPVPGQGFSTTTVTASSGQKGFLIDWPTRGQITFGRIIDNGVEYTLHYKAYFNTISDDSDSMDIESWFYLPAAFFIASHCYYAAGARRARNAQWADKTDLNVGNPLTKQAEAYYNQYLALVRGR